MDVGNSTSVDDLLSGGWGLLLEHLRVGVLLIDHQRTLRYANRAARRLLGYGPEEPLGGRCRLTTRGADCEHACPASYAQEHGLDLVEEFAAVYKDKSGLEVPAKVTLITLRDRGGERLGHLEILRPREADPGFYLAGWSEEVVELRRRLATLAKAGSHLILVGEPPCCLDVAQAVHRLAGLGEELFRRWPGSWERIPEWPPGTVFAAGAQVASLLAVAPRPGWRVIVGVDEPPSSPSVVFPVETVELPDVAERRQDLPAMIAARVEQMAPGTRIAPAALERLARLAGDLGCGGLQRSLELALAAGKGRLDDEHLAGESYRTELIDELLSHVDPLAALEKRLLCEVLERCGGRVQEAAERLGVSRATLWRKMKEHDVER